MPNVAHQTPPPQPPKPEPGDCCVTCGQLLDVERTIWIYSDGRGEHQGCR